MKSFYENHKKAFFTVIIALCFLSCGTVFGLVKYFMAEADTTVSQKPEIQAASEPVKEEEPVEEVIEEEPEIEEEILMEEAATEEALEVVEDSELDIIETPAPAPAPVVEKKASSPEPGNNAVPTADISNMAQNVPFPYEIHVNKQMNCVTVYAMDTNGAYSIPYKAMVCSTGNATPLGTYKTPAKYRWKVLMGGVWGQYSTRVTGGILFHSVQYKTNRNDTLYSSAYNKLGTTASHGCIRLTTIDAKWIYDNCPLGTTVVIYNDSNPGPLGKPTAMKVDPSNNWDPTDPDPANPWKGRILRIEGVQNQYIERGSGFDAMMGVVATDAHGNNVTGNVQVSTNADPNTAGIYGVHYLVTDALGNTASADATLTVVDTQAPVFAGIPSGIAGRNVDITRERMLAGVYVSDNGQGFPMEWVEVLIPQLCDGYNEVIYVATDASGNRATASTIVLCDSTAPVISKNGNAPSVLALNYNLDANAVIGRITVQDMSPVNVNYTLTPQEWGYRIDYTVNDSYGNVSNFTDQVSYVEYQFEGSTVLDVTSIDNINELKQGLQLKDQSGNRMDLPNDVKITWTEVSDANYRVEYSYEYKSPLGTRTAHFERTALIK